ncbi:Cation-dependent mannose-6-phosphate receptor [Camponotus floridanus]|uniref:Cation-dependent mannose-6-phosphate receptor n=1 Tax=Camponotus floridanus TaxID=104421 RepID=E2AIV4_CAMFO|nr:Cation-dependent mannose-6-phosphate receptor [Camponotus floridanus]
MDVKNRTKDYPLVLISPYGCKESYKGLSTGSVLLILFFTVTGIYFIGGIVTLRILRGATGWEMLPNHDFWSNLPLLVRVSSIIVIFLVKW